MNLKELDKEKKIFITLGIPCFVFLILIFTTHYFQMTVFFLSMMGIGIGGLLRKSKFWLSITKIGLFTVIIYLFMFYNLAHFPSQFARRMPGERQNLLQPNHDLVIEFKEDFFNWHLDTYGVSFESLSEDTRDDLELKLNRLDYYVRRVRFEYTYDTNAPYYFYDHLPTIDEIFKSDSDGDGFLQDDCDGITILTVSLLLNMGYNAWVIECEYHYYTKVFPEGADPKTEEGYEQSIDLYNSKGKLAYMIFNDEELFIPPTRPVLLSVYEIFMGTTMWDNYFLGFFNGKYFQIPFFTVIILSYVILFLLSILIIYYVKIGNSLKDIDKKTRRKNILKTALTISFICSIGVFLLYMFSISGLAALGNIVLSATLITAFRFAAYKLNRFTNNR